MQHPRFILLDFDLFVDLYLYACRHSEQDDLQFKRLNTGVRKKLESMMRHDLYSLYKTGANEETRARAKQEYLDAIGLSDSFRWNEEQDVNVTHLELNTC
ncbi:MAG: complexin-2 [Clostridiales bacterium]|nr:complexin-2 [Clostridiales bacterium]